MSDRITLAEVETGIERVFREERERCIFYLDAYNQLLTVEDWRWAQKIGVDLMGGEQ